jgi:8-oxo-dGTP pyrophosphatase MutT (NUDIX family)
MTADYKIYYNDTYVLVTSNRAQINKNFTTIFTDPVETEKFFTNTPTLFDGTTNEPIAVLTGEPEKILQLLSARVKKVIAGGGLVFNEHGELLLIHRRGKWDLPKGKIEKGEAIKDGAIREVEEETGVLVDTCADTPVFTYHTYTLYGKQQLKQTSWYTMQAKPGQQQLTPQTEEDIEEVRWVAKADLPTYAAGCYPLIWDLISHTVLK